MHHTPTTEKVTSMAFSWDFVTHDFFYQVNELVCQNSSPAITFNRSFASSADHSNQKQSASWSPSYSGVQNFHTAMAQSTNILQNILIYIQKDATLHSSFYLETALHVSGGTFTHHQDANNCIYSIWCLSQRYCYLPLSWKSWNWSECAVGGICHPQNTQTKV